MSGDLGNKVVGGIGATLLLLLLFEPSTVGYLLLGGITVFVASEILSAREEQTDPVEELLEEPRVEPEERLVGGKISRIVTPDDYESVGMTESLAARLDGEAILVLEDDGEASLIDELLQAVGLESPDTTPVLVDRETASILQEGSICAIESRQVTVPLQGVYEAASDVDLDPDLEDSEQTTESVHEITFEEGSSGDLGELFDEQSGNNLPVVKGR